MMVLPEGLGEWALTGRQLVKQELPMTLKTPGLQVLRPLFQLQSGWGMMMRRQCKTNRGVELPAARGGFRSG